MCSDIPGCKAYKLLMRFAMMGGDTKNGFVFASTRRAETHEPKDTRKNKHIRHKHCENFTVITLLL